MALKVGSRIDGRVYVWNPQPGSVAAAHLTEGRHLSIPAWTLCGRAISRYWRASVELVDHRLCEQCKRKASRE